MARPARIAAVVAATAVLMTTAGFGVTAIQQAIAAAPAAPSISAEGPVLLSGSAQDVAAASAVLGSISDTRLPSIKKILASAAPATVAVAAASAPQDTTAAAPSREHEKGHESQERDD